MERDLNLEFSECAILDDKFKKHCISLWYQVGDVNKAIDIALKEQLEDIRIFMCLNKSKVIKCCKLNSPIICNNCFNIKKCSDK